MPSLRHCGSSSSSVLTIFDNKQQLHRFSNTSNKMKISKAGPELLKKAVAAFKMKAEVLHTRVLILAALRRRMALVGAVSRRIHALVSVSLSSDGAREKQQQASVEYYGGDKQALVLHKHKAVAASQDQAGSTAAAADHERDAVIDLSEVALFQEDDDHSFPDWTTHSLFDDDNCYGYDDENAHDVGLDVLNEPSVIDIIRSNREVEGLEFNVDEEIDEACDMFIRRFRNRMNNGSF